MVKTKLQSRGQMSLASFIGIAALILLIVLISIVNHRFLLPQNITDMLVSLSTLVTLGCGMTFVLLTGGIDLSAGAIYSSCSVIFTLMLRDDLGVLAFPVAILFGTFAGALNGILYTKLRIPSFITTLGTMNFWSSFALMISGAVPLQVPVEAYPYVEFAKTEFGMIPLMFLVALVVLAISFFVQKYTSFGHRAFAVGANERSSFLAGVDADLVKILAMTASGLCAAIGGIMITGKLKSGIPTVGDAVTLQVIAACALGGTSLAGGKGSVLLTLLGCSIVVVINNGMNMVGVDMTLQQVVFGSLVIAAVSMTADRQHKEQIIK